MLENIDSRELTEWMAYEAHSGPLGDQYSNEMLASINELIQTNNRLLGAKLGKTNPVPNPKHVPRPGELLDEAKQSVYRDEGGIEWQL